VLVSLRNNARSTGEADYSHREEPGIRGKAGWDREAKLGSFLVTAFASVLAKLADRGFSPNWVRSLCGVRFGRGKAPSGERGFPMKLGSFRLRRSLRFRTKLLEEIGDFPENSYLLHSRRRHRQSPVGRAPSPARSPWPRFRQRDGGVPRGPGGPPHQIAVVPITLSQMDNQFPEIGFVLASAYLCRRRTRGINFLIFALSSPTTEAEGIRRRSGFVGLHA
jgi:hypothetical protein